MKIAVVGLGIIGGSFCKAIKKYTHHYVVGINRTQSTAQRALDDGAIDKIGTPEDLRGVQLVILCMFPHADLEFIEKNGEFINKDALVTDAAGIKRAVCPQLAAVAEKYGFTFAGSHPMAGREKNGYDASDADLFLGASYIITPCKADSGHIGFLSDFALSIGFGSVTVTTPEKHDRMIAFTSQLPHALACAYVLSPCCPEHKGYSAGSYRDVSRVASINSELWTELFLENSEPLSQELDILIENLSLIAGAVKSGDREKLVEMLEKSRRIKKELGE